MTLQTLLRPEQVAKILGVTPQTLAVWRCEKRYNLKYVKAGRLVRYRSSDVQEFIDRRSHGGEW